VRAPVPAGHDLGNTLPPRECTSTDKRGVADRACQRETRARGYSANGRRAAEDRVVDAVLAAEVGQPRRLPLLVTMVDFLIVAERGPFDPIWRVPGARGRRHRWPL